MHRFGKVDLLARMLLTKASSHSTRQTTEILILHFLVFPPLLPPCPDFFLCSFSNNRKQGEPPAEQGLSLSAEPLRSLRERGEIKLEMTSEGLEEGKEGKAMQKSKGKKIRALPAPSKVPLPRNPLSLYIYIYISLSLSLSISLFLSPFFFLSLSISVYLSRALSPSLTTWAFRTTPFGRGSGNLKRWASRSGLEVGAPWEHKGMSSNMACQKMMLFFGGFPRTSSQTCWLS